MLRVIAVGQMKSGPEAELFARYAKRVRPRLTLTEVIDRAQLVPSVPGTAFVVALDEPGESPDSLAFAKLLERWLGLSKPVCFLIGGADGLGPAAVSRAEFLLSLGPMTWPHMLARVMLAEQIYRARSIAIGHPYHRAGTR